MSTIQTPFTTATFSSYTSAGIVFQFIHLYWHYFLLGRPGQLLIEFMPIDINKDG